MAIGDLLWACPRCGREGGLARVSRREHACAGCGTRYRRAEGASIEAIGPDGGRTTCSAAAWIDALPELGEERFLAGEAAEIHAEPAVARFAAARSIIRQRGLFLNRVETFGPRMQGRLALRADRLVFEGETERPIAWRVDAITAVQAASRDLQVKARGCDLVMFRFPQGSARFWEELLTRWLRRHYHAEGRGAIVEFQPRISTR